LNSPERSCSELCRLPAPPQGNTLAADRTLTVDIAIPEAVSYSHATFNNVRVYLVGLDTTEDLAIQFIKRGISKFVDRNGKVPPSMALAGLQLSL
jgi:hypothetical protein